MYHRDKYIRHINEFICPMIEPHCDAIFIACSGFEMSNELLGLG